MAASRRPRLFATSLLNTKNGGVTEMVQSNVHSTSVGAEKTIKFISQLLEDLEDCIDEFLHENLVEKLILSHEQEVELGTLLSASCLTIRYVTEREAFLRFLPRFRATFLAVVRSENWHRSLMGLKMVALMGCTRLLESFGEFTGLEIVLTDLEWFYGLIVESSIETKLHYLLRPICEYIGVSIQTHPEACIFIYGELLGALLRLVTKSKEVLTLSIENTQELVNTIAVLLDMKLAPLPNALSLLSMPSFIQRQEEEGDDGEVENELSYERNFVITSTTKNIDSKLLLEMSECLIRIIQKKLEDKLTIACLPALVLLWRFACQDLGISIASVGLQNCIHAIIQTQESLKLKTLMDYELFQVSLETIRDLLLSFQTEIPLLSQIFDQLANVMPCLENSIRQLDKQLVRQAKPMCSSIRQVLVEAFVAFIHASGNGFRQFSNDFVGVSAGKLADPRVFGDVLYSLRHCKNDEEAAFACEKILNQLTSALKQLERYSKEAQGRILCAISRVAFVYTQYAMEPHQLTDLGQFLLGSLVESKLMGKKLPRFYRKKLEALACLLFGEGKSNGSQKSWAHEFIEYLYDEILKESDYNIDALQMTLSLLRDPKSNSILLSRQEKERIVQIIKGFLKILENVKLEQIFEEEIEILMLQVDILQVLVKEKGNSFQAEYQKLIKKLDTKVKAISSDNMIILIEFLQTKKD